MKIEPGDDIWTYTVNSETTSDRYTVNLLENDGHGQCDCDNWRFRVAPMLDKGMVASCKHIQQCRIRLAMDVIGAEVERTRPVNRVQSEYAEARQQWLSENSTCACCPSPAADVHHSRGRLGDLLMDERYWVPVCRVCHDWIHSNMDAARDLVWEGRPLLCARGDWNRQVED